MLLFFHFLAVWQLCVISLPCLHPIALYHGREDVLARGIETCPLYIQVDNVACTP